MQCSNCQQTKFSQLHRKHKKKTNKCISKTKSTNIITSGQKSNSQSVPHNNARSRQPKFKTSPNNSTCKPKNPCIKNNVRKSIRPKATPTSNRTGTKFSTPANNKDYCSSTEKNKVKQTASPITKSTQCDFIKGTPRSSACSAKPSALTTGAVCDMKKKPPRKQTPAFILKLANYVRRSKKHKREELIKVENLQCAQSQNVLTAIYNLKPPAHKKRISKALTPTNSINNSLSVRPRRAAPNVLAQFGAYLKGLNKTIPEEAPQHQHQPQPQPHPQRKQTKDAFTIMHYFKQSAHTNFSNYFKNLRKSKAKCSELSLSTALSTPSTFSPTTSSLEAMLMRIAEEIKVRRLKSNPSHCPKVDIDAILEGQLSKPKKETKTIFSFKLFKPPKKLKTNKMPCELPCNLQQQATDSYIKSKSDLVIKNDVLTTMEVPDYPKDEDNQKSCPLQTTTDLVIPIKCLINATSLEDMVTRVTQETKCQLVKSIEAHCSKVNDNSLLEIKPVKQKLRQLKKCKKFNIPKKRILKRISCVLPCQCQNSQKSEHCIAEYLKMMPIMLEKTCDQHNNAKYM